MYMTKQKQKSSFATKIPKLVCVATIVEFDPLAPRGNVAFIFDEE